MQLRFGLLVEDKGDSIPTQYFLGNRYAVLLAPSDLGSPIVKLSLPAALN
jgi:hypothetical protein